MFTIVLYYAIVSGVFVFFLHDQDNNSGGVFTDRSMPTIWLRSGFNRLKLLEWSP